MLRLQVHISGDDPIVLEVEELPKPDSVYIIGINPQRRDGKEVSYFNREVNEVMLPWWRVNFVQILPSEDEADMPTFVRD